MSYNSAVTGKHCFSMSSFATVTAAYAAEPRS